MCFTAWMCPCVPLLVCAHSSECVCLLMTLFVVALACFCMCVPMIVLVPIPVCICVHVCVSVCVCGCACVCVKQSPSPMWLITESCLPSHFVTSLPFQSDKRETDTKPSALQQQGPSTRKNMFPLYLTQLDWGLHGNMATHILSFGSQVMAYSKENVFPFFSVPRALHGYQASPGACVCVCACVCNSIFRLLS